MNTDIVYEYELLQERGLMIQKYISSRSGCTINNIHNERITEKYEVIQKNITDIMYCSVKKKNFFLTNKTMSIIWVTQNKSRT